MRAELDGDLDGTLATMVEDPHLLNLPPGTGGLGAEGVRAFDANDLIGQFFPPDAVFIPISRTIDGERLHHRRPPDANRSGGAQVGDVIGVRPDRFKGRRITRQQAVSRRIEGVGGILKRGGHGGDQASLGWAITRSIRPYSFASAALRK